MPCADDAGLSVNDSAVRRNEATSKAPAFSTTDFRKKNWLHMAFCSSLSESERGAWPPADMICRQRAAAWLYGLGSVVRSHSGTQPTAADPSSWDVCSPASAPGDELELRPYRGV